MHGMNMYAQFAQFYLVKAGSNLSWALLLLRALRDVRVGPRWPQRLQFISAAVLLGWGICEWALFDPNFGLWGLMADAALWYDRLKVLFWLLGLSVPISIFLFAMGFYFAQQRPAEAVAPVPAAPKE